MEEFHAAQGEDAAAVRKTPTGAAVESDQGDDRRREEQRSRGVYGARAGEEPGFDREEAAPVSVVRSPRQRKRNVSARGGARRR